MVLNSISKSNYPLKEYLQHLRSKINTFFSYCLLEIAFLGIVLVDQWTETQKKVDYFEQVMIFDIYYEMLLLLFKIRSIADLDVIDLNVIFFVNVKWCSNFVVKCKSNK